MKHGPRTEHNRRHERANRNETKERILDPTPDRCAILPHVVVQNRKYGHGKKRPDEISDQIHGLPEKAQNHNQEPTESDQDRHFR